jgi:hypothetical protein
MQVGVFGAAAVRAEVLKEPLDVLAGLEILGVEAVDVVVGDEAAVQVEMLIEPPGEMGLAKPVPLEPLEPLETARPVVATTVIKCAKPRPCATVLCRHLADPI